MSESDPIVSEEQLQILLNKARTLSEALPYIREFQGETVVVKYGGAAMESEELKQLVMQDVLLLSLIGMKPVLVHGGGPEISSLMDRLGLEPKFVAGMRVTDEAGIEVVEMVLSRVRGSIVAHLNKIGARAVGISGKDGGLFHCHKLAGRNKKGEEEGLDYGFVGEISDVDPSVIRTLDDTGFIPVVSPLAVDSKGQTYNINADLAAAELARALKARKFVLLTDVRGVLRDPEKPESLITTIPANKVDNLIDEGVVTGGMIPKTRACLRALDEGVRKAHILDGRLPHSLLLEFLTDSGVGTQIVKS